MQVCVAVTPYIFGVFSTISIYSEYEFYRHSFSQRGHSIRYTFKSTTLCCRIDRIKKDDIISNIALECSFPLSRTMRIVANVSIEKNIYIPFMYQ